MLRSVKDIADAYTQGRVHTQRFLKNAGTSQNGLWEDWAYASGQPALEPRVGNPLAFLPYVSAGNKAIYFPPKLPEQQRFLTEVVVRALPNGTGQTSIDFQMYDLLGVYPLIDGDSTDLQELDNTLTLPRYTDGVGVKGILVNQISAASGVTGLTTTVNYTGTDNVDRDATVYVSNSNPLAKASFSLAPAVSQCPLYLPFDSSGVKKVNNVTFAIAPGGLWAVYLVKPICLIENQVGAKAGALTASIFSEKSLVVENGFMPPEIFDGASLGFFYLPVGSTRTTSIFGKATFIWG